MFDELTFCLPLQTSTQTVACHHTSLQHSKCICGLQQSMQFGVLRLCRIILRSKKFFNDRAQPPKSSPNGILPTRNALSFFALVTTSPTHFACPFEHETWHMTHAASHTSYDHGRVASNSHILASAEVNEVLFFDCTSALTSKACAPPLRQFRKF